VNAAYKVKANFSKKKPKKINQRPKKETSQIWLAT